jgi:hypothetical protein
MVYPAATISLPGRKTSSTLPFAPSCYIVSDVFPRQEETTYHLVDTKDGTDIDTSVNVTRTIQRVKDHTADN